MSELIKNVEHKNHLDHLIVVIPILVFFMMIQFFIMKSLFPEQALGNYFIFLGLSLSTLITSFTIYDSYHRLLIFKSSIIVNSPFKFKAIQFQITEIDKVFNLTGETSFGTIVFLLKNKKKRTCFFVDNPEEIKTIVDNLIKNNIQNEQKEAA